MGIPTTILAALELLNVGPAETLKNYPLHRLATFDFDPHFNLKTINHVSMKAIQ